MFLKGVIYASSKGGYDIAFEEMDKSAKVKNILSIEIIGSVQENIETVIEENTEVLEILVNGFEFSTENNSLEFVTVNVEKQDKEGNFNPSEWSGYLLSDVLEANDITEFSILTIEASDGYSIEIDYDMAMFDTTILGFIQDGLSIEDSAPKLVVDGEENKIWISQIAKITTK